MIVVFLPAFRNSWATNFAKISVTGISHLVYGCISESCSLLRVPPVLWEVLSFTLGIML